MAKKRSYNKYKLKFFVLLFAITILLFSTISYFINSKQESEYQYSPRLIGNTTAKPITPKIPYSLQNQPGWPVELPNGNRGRIVYGDIDKNYPGMEIIITNSVEVQISPYEYLYYVEVYIFHEDGTKMENWDPLVLENVDVGGYTSASLSDIDRDGELEIILTFDIETVNYRMGVVYVLKNDGSIANGWPKLDFTNRPANHMPVIADLDRDGYLEVLISAADGFLHIWRYDGSEYNPEVWPMEIGSFVQGGDYGRIAPAVANLDSDPELEIVISGSGTNLIYALNEDGSPLNENWPVSIDEGYGAFTPSLADINEDGQLEIIIGANWRVYGNWEHPLKVYVFSTDGFLLSGWPKTGQNGQHPREIVIADLDRNYPGLEVITSPGAHHTGSWPRPEDELGKTIYAWHYDGTNIPGWPYVADELGYYFEEHSPVVGDFNNDLNPEMVITMDNFDFFDSEHKLYFIKFDGAELMPPITYNLISREPTIGDIDNDGKLEIMTTEAISGVGTRIHVQEFVGLIGNKNFWPMMGLNKEHTSALSV